MGLVGIPFDLGVRVVGVWGGGWTWTKWCRVAEGSCSCGVSRGSGRGTGLLCVCGCVGGVGCYSPGGMRVVSRRHYTRALPRAARACVAGST